MGRRWAPAPRTRTGPGGGSSSQLVGPRRYVGPVALIGWGDESGSDATRDPGTYIVSVSLADQEAIDKIHEAMRPLVFKGTPKLHWRDERPPRRHLIAQMIASLPISGLIVIRSRPQEPDERPERRRRKCLEQLLWTLDARGCSQLTLESRGTKDDQEDRKLVGNLRACRHMSSQLRLDHVPGPQDPCPWVADALCQGPPSCAGSVSGRVLLRARPRRSPGPQPGPGTGAGGCGPSPRPGSPVPAPRSAGPIPSARPGPGR